MQTNSKHLENELKINSICYNIRKHKILRYKFDKTMQRPLYRKLHTIAERTLKISTNGGLHHVHELEESVSLNINSLQLIYSFSAILIITSAGFFGVNIIKLILKQKCKEHEYQTNFEKEQQS